MQRRTFLRTGAALAAIAGNRTLRTSAQATTGDDRPAGVMECVRPDATTGASQAVVVGDVPLVHIEQTPEMPDDRNESNANNRAATSVEFAFEELSRRLKSAGSTLQDVVKFNFYLGSDAALPRKIEERLAVAFPGNYKPAVTYTVGATTVGCTADCIALYRKPAEPVVSGKVLRFEGAAVLPPTNQLYISGDAAAGPLMSVVGETLASLEKTLSFCGLDWSHVVQLKSFLQPISLASDVRREMQTWFGTRPLPVLTFVEWQSSEKIPIEIELVAAVPSELGNQSGDTVEYLTPPHMKSSPVFSRVARIKSDRTIYVSGLYGDSADAEDQVRDVFAALKQVVEPLGGDLRHLVKATYYVTDDAVSKALGAIRPEFYDPARPPAASKAMVAGTGRPERSLTVDMIAVPRIRS